MDPQKPIEWHKLNSGAMLGMQGDQLLCIVEKIEDLPVEGWCPNILQDTFTTPEGAMAEGEKILQRIERHDRSHDEPPTPPLSSTMLPLLKMLVTYLEATSPDPLVLKIGRSPTVERTTSDEAGNSGEAKP